MSTANVSPIVSVEEILRAVASGKITPENAAAMIPSRNHHSVGTLSCKVSPKGALSVYGLQRMPVSLYAEQWERLLEFASQIKAFIQNHRELARKARG
jgi:predicted ATP-grasp superfamily ATP-dependent carboligase